ncbi:hypothetical protein J1N35_040133 [Gossypium stocksii]|uniref:DUF4283 domain-containing protein n=1 Tax=Gossypium stocksii TaxID=47602 RepID=A0A9D3UDC6_9ROSI|nr:hypothetical protein J1N35_040133 [Gossypium stocksii]
MEEGLANLHLLDEEEEAFHEEDSAVDRSYQFCLVGRYLTDSVGHFPSLRNTMTDLWHSIGEIYISDIGDKRILFQFFHAVDVQRMLFGTPWFFNNHLLILHEIQWGEDPLVVLLFLSEFWVQIHDLSPGKKNIQTEKERTVYARFRYEKLSLFCFICSKLGYGESFCQFCTRLDPSKIVFG